LADALPVAPTRVRNAGLIRIDPQNALVPWSGRNQLAMRSKSVPR
jgi:hypothetical protein